MSCVIGWSCEVVNAAQIEGYGLGDHVEIIAPGDGAALNADLIGAYEKGDPWLGYQWGTNEPALVLDLVRLEEPEYTDECWFTTKACAYEDATILIAVHPDVVANAPDVIAMLRAWTFDVTKYRVVAAWFNDNAGADANDAALWWLSANEDVWSTWVTEEAADTRSAPRSTTARSRPAGPRRRRPGAAQPAAPARESAQRVRLGHSVASSRLSAPGQSRMC